MWTAGFIMTLSVFFGNYPSRIICASGDKCTADNLCRKNILLLQKMAESEKRFEKYIIEHVDVININELNSANCKDRAKAVDESLDDLCKAKPHLTANGDRNGVSENALNSAMVSCAMCSLHTILCLQELKNDSENSSYFKRPTFISDWFKMKSQDALSETYIEHRLGYIPLKVDIQVKVSDKIFPGQRSIQSDDDTDIPYGGINYVYNETHVMLVAPRRFNGKYAGKAVFTGAYSGEWIGSENIEASEVLVRVRVWGRKNIPVPDFSSDWIPVDQSKTYAEVRHGFNEYPVLETVQVKACGWVEDASGSVMTMGKEIRQIGGAVYAVSKQNVRIWTVSVPNSKMTEWGLLHAAKDGWGNQPYKVDPLCASGTVRVLAWKDPSFNALPYSVKMLPSTGLTELNVDDKIDLENNILNVYVEANDGVNKGYRFIGQGSAQNQLKPFGGIIFCYSQSGDVLIWRPNEEKDGYLINVVASFGNGENAQSSNEGKIVAVSLKPRC